jgi:hypothetical protein
MKRFVVKPEEKINLPPCTLTVQGWALPPPPPFYSLEVRGGLVSLLAVLQLLALATSITMLFLFALFVEFVNAMTPAEREALLVLAAQQARKGIKGPYKWARKLFSRGFYESMGFTDTFSGVGAKNATTVAGVENATAIPHVPEMPNLGVENLTLPVEEKMLDSSWLSGKYLHGKPFCTFIVKKAKMSFLYMYIYMYLRYTYICTFNFENCCTYFY